MCSPSLTHYLDCLKFWERQDDGYFFNMLEGWSSIWKHLHNTNLYTIGSFDFKDYRLLQTCPTPHADTRWFHSSLLLHMFLLPELPPTTPNLFLLENSLLSHKTLHQPFILWLYSRPLLSHIYSHSLPQSTPKLKHFLLCTSIARAFCTFFLLFHASHCTLMICLQIYLHASLKFLESAQC